MDSGALEGKPVRAQPYRAHRPPQEHAEKRCSHTAPRRQKKFSIYEKALAKSQARSPGAEPIAHAHNKRQQAPSNHADLELVALSRMRRRAVDRFASSYIYVHTCTSAYTCVQGSMYMSGDALRMPPGRIANWHSGTHGIFARRRGESPASAPSRVSPPPTHPGAPATATLPFQRHPHRNDAPKPPARKPRQQYRSVSVCKR